MNHTAGDSSGSAPALELRDIVRTYGAVRALDGASLVVRRGTVHAVLGENGAGKTTLVRCAFAMVHPESGTVAVDGASFTGRSPADALRRGIGMVHQHFTLVPAMTVTENVALGGAGRLDRQAARARVVALADRTGFAIDPDARVEDLPVGAQQRVEILKALARGARLLMLDEPTAMLAPSEAAELDRWLRRYVADGNSAVIVTHKLRDALAVADDVTVLRHGRTVLAAPAGAIDEQSLVAAMLGDAPSASGSGRPETRDRSPAAEGGFAFRARGLSVAGRGGRTAIVDATFDVGRGVIVGIAGVEGAGQAELLRALAGRLPVLSGTLERPARVGFVPEDRHRDALVLDFDLMENVALGDAGGARGTVAWRGMRERATALMSGFDVRAASARAVARTLSGGNQQKLVLARELAVGQEALVVENPTRGLDVRAIAAVHGRLRAARDAGAAVVVHSSDLDEVLTLADRVLVVHAGRVHEPPRDRATIGRALLGA